MRKFLISAALLSAAAISAPAAAQYGHDQRGYGYGHDRGYGDRNAERQIQQELGRLHERIDRSADRRRLSRGESIRLQRQFDNIERRFSQYRYNGLSGREYQDLQRRIGNLRARLQDDRRDGRRRW